ncbi:hypothetical protein G9A89_001438 [Geosiphon pyriformis]|nr:hypothetical protein G9A89_001438 [Geosiphon pyriformis]
MFKLHIVKRLPAKRRYGHTAVLVNQKIYFLGGIDSTSDHIFDDFFSLDLSKRFNTNSNSFELIHNKKSIPKVARASAFVVHDTKILVCGGIEKVSDIKTNGTETIRASRSIYSIDLKSTDSWTKKGFNSELEFATRNKTFPFTIDQSGKIYAFISSRVINDSSYTYYQNLNETNLNLIENSSISILNNKTSRFVNESAVYVFDTVTNSWSMRQPKVKGNSETPLPGYEFTATFLDDGRIVYIGGKSNNGNYADMSKIWTYDTKKDEWNINIIIYGGFSDLSITGANALAILDTRNWIWKIPKNDNQNSIPFSHSAIFYRDYMIVAFGYVPLGNNITTGKPIEKNYLSILDTSNNSFNWLTAYIPRDKLTPGTSSKTENNSIPDHLNIDASTSKSSIGKIVGLLIGLSVFIFGGLLFWFCWRRIKKNDIRRQRNTPVFLSPPEKSLVVPALSASMLNRNSTSPKPSIQTLDSIESDLSTTTSSLNTPEFPNLDSYIVRGNRGVSLSGQLPPPRPKFLSVPPMRVTSSGHISASVVHAL